MTAEFGQVVRGYREARGFSLREVEAQTIGLDLLATAVFILQR